MTPEQRRAHLVLQRQTLLDEWNERCRSFDEARVLWGKAGNIGACSIDGSVLHKKGDEVRLAAIYKWRAAVENELGPNGIADWTGQGCVLSNGEVYLYPA